MLRTLLRHDSRDRGTTVPAGHRRDVEDRGVLDFRHDGDYPPPWRTSLPAEPVTDRPLRTGPPAGPPVAGDAVGYRPAPYCGYAIVQYDSASRVRWVIAPFADALSAEEYAIDGDLTAYDVVSATPVVRGTS
jgi:hypothetical protein